MATKAEERKALAQIRKIVEGLGENSYIGMAFEGCFDDAEENIENDWGCSQKQRADSAEKKTEEYKTIRDELVAENKKAEELIARMQKDFEIVCNREKRAMDRNDELLKQVKESSDNATKNWNAYCEQVNKVEDLQQEIIRLKARLFDMMEAQGA